MDKERSREIREQIRRILLEHWDPIGIKDEPRAQDEYDGYIGPIFILLESGAAHEQLANHLWKIVQERIQLHPQAGATERTVKALKSINFSG
jgi:hypothetical protein